VYKKIFIAIALSAQEDKEVVIVTRFNLLTRVWRLCLLVFTTSAKHQIIKIEWKMCLEQRQLHS